MTSYQWMVIHHTVGSLASAENRFNTPGSGASAHFGIGEDGTIIQWVDTADVAYHACNANWTGGIGVEHETPAEGDVWRGLTDVQLSASARLLAWLNAEHGVPLVVTDDPQSPGLAYHSMNPGPCASHWGLTGCPGDAIIAQRPEIVTQAAGVSPADNPVPVPAPIPTPPPTILRKATGMISVLLYDTLNDFYVDDAGHLIQKFYDVGTSAWKTVTLSTQCKPGSDVGYLDGFQGNLHLTAKHSDGLQMVHCTFVRASGQWAEQVH